MAPCPLATGSHKRVLYTVKLFQRLETARVATRMSCLGMVCSIMKTDCVMLILKNDYDVNNLQKVDHSNNVKLTWDLKKGT